MSYADCASLVRIIFGPPFAFILYLQLSSPGRYPHLAKNFSPDIILFLFLVLVLTDWLDGRLAKKYGETRLGAFLDPLADKIFLWSYSVALVFTVAWNAVAIFALLLICDVISTAERIFGYRRSENKMEANSAGKIKTAFHSAAIAFFLLTPVFYSIKSPEEFWSVATSVIGYILLWPAFICSLISLINKAEQWRGREIK
ncbi:MAG: CDP-alcohol phosphatidyltransferase family protein [Patescibacteria group bacterium]